MQVESPVPASTDATAHLRGANPTRALVFALVYLACAATGRTISGSTTYVSFWLPAGVYLAALVLHERSSWPWFLAGGFVANLGFDLWHGTPLPVTLLFCVANLVQATSGAWLIERSTGRIQGVETFREFFALIGWAALVSTALGAAIGAATLFGFGFSRDFAESWKLWWGSNGMAILIVTPFLITWFDDQGLKPIPRQFKARAWELGLMFALLAAGTWWLLVEDQGLSAPYKSRLFPVLLWVGVRFGLHGATLATLVLSVLMAFLTTRYQIGLTPHDIESGNYVFVLQTFLGVSALVALVPAIALGAREKTLAELRESEERFRQMSGAAFEGICISENGRIVDANEQALRMFRTTREHFLGRPLLEFVAPETRELVAQSVGEQRELAYEHVLLRADGEPFPAEAQARVIHHGGRTLRMTALRDITERKKAETAQRESEAVLRQFIKHAPAAMAITDTEIRYLQASDRWLADFHLTGQDVIGKSHYELFPDLPERWKEAHRRALAGAIQRNDEDLFVRADGTREWLEWEIRPWYRADGGSLAGLILFAQLITERKNAEVERAHALEQQRQLEAQLRQAQKMEAIGTLAGGIAHDFNNILGSILAHTELARMDNPENPVLRQNLDQVIESSRRAASLVRQILTFSRRQPQERRKLDAAPLLSEAMKLLRSTLPTTIEFEIRITEPLPAVFADATQLHQIVVNLGTNAGHAMRGSHGKLVLTAAAITIERPNPELGLPPGSYLEIALGDTGHGMSDDVRQRIFEPFFTTKGPGDGTGLGLAVVHGIVLEHGGAIRVESEVGKGSVFHVYLPAAGGQPGAANEQARELRPGGGERILLVDDEAPLADATGKLLTRYGYRPAMFHDSLEAWKAFSAAPDAFDLVITDLTMPQLAGPELARKMRELRADIPIILTTGSRHDLSNEAAEELGIRDIFLKPVDYPLLLESIQRLLSARLS